jgi:hypothetical protein
MSLTFNPTPYDLLSALATWAAVFAGCAAVALLAALLVGLLTGGAAGARRGVAGLFGGVVDLVRVSPGRVWAMAQLTFRESIRRKALLVFAVFALLFMFGGWFLTRTDQRPFELVQGLVAFVLMTTSFLVLPVALLLSCWGIPEDIRRRSLHTIVTKPVRRSEIVLGRILGYAGICTLILVVMAGVGYFWIERQVPEEARSALVSRVPIFGTLSYLDAEGKPAEKGKNVGDIWQHRSYIEGATRERAVYLFDGVTPDAMTPVRVRDASGNTTDEERLRLESTFEAFRTYKGDMSRGIYVKYTYVNPDMPDKRRVDDPNIFPIQEFQTNVQNVAREIPVDDPSAIEKDFLITKEIDLPGGGKAKRYFVDLFKYLAPNGRLRVEVAALDGGQYLGMAPADFFVRLRDRDFLVGYSKAVLGIWLMTVLVVVLGVTASTFLKGPIATLLTLTLLIVGGMSREFMDKMAVDFQQQKLEGGGPIESIIRIIGHMNPSVPMQESPVTSAVQAVDKVFLGGVWVIRYLIPNFGAFNLTEYPEKGYDVGWGTSPGLLPAVAVTLGFLLPCVLIGYYSLRFRELESK